MITAKLNKSVKVTHAARWAPVVKVSGGVYDKGRRQAFIALYLSGTEERFDTIGGVPTRRYDVAPYLDSTNPVSRRVPVRGTWRVKAKIIGNAIQVVCVRRLGQRVTLTLATEYPLSTGSDPYAGKAPELPRWRWTLTPGPALILAQSEEAGESETFGAALWRAWTRAVEVLAADGGARSSQRVPKAGLPADEELWLPARVDRLRAGEAEAPKAKAAAPKPRAQGALFGG